MSDPPFPVSRRDRQRRTREALIFAARAVFSRDGYSGANLETIAREAGFSKGAVYSNFDSKAGLFLAVIDTNIEAAFAEGGWDLFGRSADALGEAEDLELEGAIRGFALATLEFVATAARDAALADELTRRMRRLVDTYAGIAGDSRAPGEWLAPDEIGALLTALDQGIGLLTLSGIATIDQRVMRAGLQRLLDPARALETGNGDTDDPDRAGKDDAGPVGRPALHDEVTRRRILDSIREQ